MARRTHSMLDDPEVKALVQAMLEAGKTYDEIRTEVQRQTGKTISRSALSRGKQRWDSAAAMLAAAKREAEVIQGVLQAHPDASLVDAAMGLMLGKLTHRFADAEASFEDADPLEVGHLLVKTMRAGLMKDALGLQRERLELLKQKVQAAAEKVRDTMTAAKVPPEQVASLVDEILGVTA